MSSVARTGLRVGLAGFFLIGANNALQNASAEGDTRTLTFHHLHTKEDITVTFKRNGRYDEAALKKLNWFMRDWRKDEQVEMDRNLFDVLWEAYREVGATQPIQVVCGYRSPATNAMLRNRSAASGVAEVSQHTAGHAMDFYIPGVSLEKLREVGLRLQRGGVGFYPSSGSPFVHMDTGTIRHWPRMTYAQLSKVFPDGRTVHVASDGKPLPGYAQALADVEARGNEPSEMSLAAAREHGIDTTTAGNPQRSLFAALFGRKDRQEPSAAEDTTTASAKTSRKPTVVASAAPPKPVATERLVPMPAAKPKALLAAATPKADDKITTAAILPRPAPFEARGVWVNPVEKGEDLPAVAEAAPFKLASADTPTPAQAPLAYAAADSVPSAATQARPMGAVMSSLTREAKALPASNTGAVAMKAPPLTFGGQGTDSPWLRALVLAPSVSYMTATRMGAIDQRPFVELLHKPAQSLAMGFSADPMAGLAANRFSGSAVVFLATATFARQTTASLR